MLVLTFLPFLRMICHLKKSHNGAQLADNVFRGQQERNKSNEAEIVIQQSFQSNSTEAASDLPTPTHVNVNDLNASSFKDDKSTNKVPCVKASIVKDDKLSKSVPCVKASEPKKETIKVVFSKNNDEKEDDDDEDNFRFGCEQCWFAAETESQLSEHVQAKHPIVDLTESDERDPIIEEIAKEKIALNASQSTKNKLEVTKTVTANNSQLENAEVVKTVSHVSQLSATEGRGNEDTTKPTEKEEKTTEIVSKEVEVIHTDDQTTKESIASSEASMFEDDNDENDSRFQCNFCWFASETKEELSNHIKNDHKSNLEDMDEEKNDSSKSKSPEVTQTNNQTFDSVEMTCTTRSNKTDNKTVETEENATRMLTDLQTSDKDTLSKESDSESVQASPRTFENEKKSMDVECIEVIQPNEISNPGISNQEAIDQTEISFLENMDQTAPDFLNPSSVIQATESLQQPIVIDLESNESTATDSSTETEQPTVIDLESIESVQLPTVSDGDSTEQPTDIVSEETETVQQPNDPLSNSTDSPSFQTEGCQPMETDKGQNNENPLQSNESQEEEDQNTVQEMELESNQWKSASGLIQVPKKSKPYILVPEIYGVSSMETFESERTSKASQNDPENCEMETASNPLSLLTDGDVKTDLFLETSNMIMIESDVKETH